MVEETTNEIWKDIPEYESLYQISSMGRVKSMERKVLNSKGYRIVRERILKPVKDKGGYLFIGLWKKGILKNMKIHRLVASAFLTNPNNLPQINHKNECKTDNRVENLEYCTQEYNNNFGTHNERCAKANINNPKTSKKVKCLNTGVIYSSLADIQRKFGFDKSSISRCCVGKQKTSYGLHWEFA